MNRSKTKARNIKNELRNNKKRQAVSNFKDYKDYLEKLDNQMLKLFWFCSGSAVSMAIVFSGSPAWAEKQLAISNTSNLDVSLDVSLNQTSESHILQLSDLADSGSRHGNLFVTNLDAGFDNVAFDNVSSGDKGDRGISGNSIVDSIVNSIDHAAAQTLPAELKKADYSADALTQSTRLTAESPAEFPIESSTEFSTEPTELLPLNPIAQADAPGSPLSEPSSEPPPAETPSEPASEPQPSEQFPATPSSGWQFSVEPYFFVPLDVNADVTVSGRRASLELGLDDILSLDRAFDAGLRLRAQNDRLGFILDGFYLYAENSGNLGRTFSSGSIFQFVQRNSPGTLEEFVQRFDPVQLQQLAQIGQQIGLNTPIRVSADGTVSVRQITIDAAVSYRVVDTSLNNSSEETNFYPRLVVAPIAGVRTNFLRQTIEVDNIRINNRRIPDRALPPIDRDFSFSRTLVEPLVGAQIDLALSERWALGFRGDVSGFNIGARQNFTWNLIFGTQYNISRNVALQLAYRFNAFDFETGEGLRRAELNLRQNGLLLNTIFLF